MSKNSADGQVNARWQLSDTITVLVQIAVPLTAALIVQFHPDVSKWNEATKLSIIGLGILAPIIIQQITNLIAQNKNERTSAIIEARLEDLDKKLSHVNPMLERVFMSNNERIMRFALRRAEEVKLLVKYAMDNQRSGNLKPREYYDELDHLAQRIRHDRKIMAKNFRGEIWAMTSFAPDEWIKDDGYEGPWIDTLKSMVAMGIKTRRICIVPSRLMDLISGESFSIPSDIPQFSGFMKLLRDYYGPGCKRDIARHYIIRDTTNAELTSIAGFFAIKLSNGEMHILTGETIDKFGSLTAEALFNENEIRAFSVLCDKFMTDRYALEKVIKEVTKPKGFHAHLVANEVRIT
jgi:hypothetical protein